MKILVEARPMSVFGGFQAAAETMEHTWVWWEEAHTPAFDVFDGVNPDWFFCMSDFSRAVQKCLNERPDLNIVIGYEGDRFSFSRVTRESSPKAKKFEFGRLVDSHKFYASKSDPSMVCDIGISCAPNSMGLKICHEAPYNVKVVNEESWPVSQYLGVASLEMKRRLYTSADLVLVDNMTEAMRVLICGAIPMVSDGSHVDIPGIPVVQTIEEVYDLFKLMRYDEERWALSKQLFNRDTDFSYHAALMVLLTEEN